MSTAAAEAFRFLNAGTILNYRGCGDTATAARDRAAKDAGITPAQAERLWKRWRWMASVDGDVYRSLRNKYECSWAGRYQALCEGNESASAAYRAERLQLKAERHETDKERASARVGKVAARGRAAEKAGTER